MAKSAFDTLVGILNGTDHVSSRSVYGRRCYMHKEFIFLKSSMKSIPCFMKTLVVNNTTEDVVDKIRQSYRQEDNIVFERIIICHSIYGFNFNSIFRCVIHYGMPVKWVSDKGTYYVFDNMVFDKDKKLMFAFHNNVNVIVRQLFVEKECFDKTDYMSKFIISTFIPAYEEAIGGDVIIKDLKTYTPSFHNRYADSDTIDKELNNKLHYFSETFELM